MLSTTNVLSLLLTTLSTVPLPSSSLQHVLRIGSRPSPLAVIQAESVASALSEARPGLSIELVRIDAGGDVRGRGRQDEPLAFRPPDFVGTIDLAVADGTVDVGVHSLKDVPPDGRWEGGQGRLVGAESHHRLTIGCCLGPRANPLDVLLVRKSSAAAGGASPSLNGLPRGARVGSASIRRQAQLMARRPDVSCVNLRGNVRARLEALEDGEVDALVMAGAGLERLGIDCGLDGDESDGERGGEGRSLTGTLLGPDVMLPGCCQGIVGCVCRQDDKETLGVLSAVDDKDARIAAEAERSVLNVVDGLAPWEGRPPLAALMSRSGGEGGWVLKALVARPDGTKIIRARKILPSVCSIRESKELGEQVGKELLQLAGPNFFN